MPHALQARVVLPVDSPPIEHGVVTIDGERIVGVGPQAAADASLEDLGDVALLPGLVNAHTHLEFSYLQRPLGRPGIPLVDWLRLAIAERGRPAEATADAIAAGLRESVAGGVTSIGEIATADLQGDADTHSVDLTPFVEVIGFSRARADSALAALEQRLHACGQLSRSKLLGISPHAPYTVSPDLLRRLVTLANRQNLPVAMHLAESEEELRFLAAGGGPFQELLEERSMWDKSAVPRGTRPLDYLQTLADAPRAVVVHGNYLDADERAFLANQAGRMSLVYCPRTHAYFGHAPYPLDELLAAGVRVALGTDSRASNPDLSLLAEMRHVANKYPRIGPSTILRMGTLAGGEALGRADETGSLAPGKLANLVAVPLSADAGDPEDLLLGILTSDEEPCGTWIHGMRATAKPPARDGG